MNIRDEYIKETIRLLKKEYDLSLTELIDAYTESISVPATIFSTTLTPYEALCLFLADVKNIAEPDIAKLLNRRTSSVKSALENAHNKKETLTENSTPYRIPVDALKDERLSPAEAVVLYLHNAYQLRNTDIAKILGKDPRNTHELLRRAEKKQEAAQ